MAFGNLPDLKLFLGIKEGDTSEDSALSNMLNFVSSMIEDYCDRSFGQKNYTEVYSGNGSAYLALRQRPVSVIGLTVWMDDNSFYGSELGAWDSTTLLSYGTDYCLSVDIDQYTSQCGILQSISGVWDCPFSYSPTIIYPQIEQGIYSWGNIKVSYLAGYSDIPDSVNLALYSACAAVRNSKNYGQLLGNESLSDGAGSSSYGLKREAKLGWLTPEVGFILSKYRNVATA
jgi:hypothetical protein